MWRRAGVRLRLKSTKRPPPPPLEGTCCMSGNFLKFYSKFTILGCPNCVWLEHADELIAYYGTLGKDEAIRSIKASVDDPMMQQLLIMEIKFK